MRNKVTPDFLDRKAELLLSGPLQSSKPVAAIHVQSNPEQALSRDVAPIRVTLFLTRRAMSRKSRTEQALCRGLAPARGYFVPKGRTAFAVKWSLQSSKPVAAIHVQSNTEQALQ